MQASEDGRFFQGWKPRIFANTRAALGAGTHDFRTDFTSDLKRGLRFERWAVDPTGGITTSWLIMMQLWIDGSLVFFEPAQPWIDVTAKVFIPPNSLVTWYERYVIVAAGPTTFRSFLNMSEFDIDEAGHGSLTRNPNVIPWV